MKAAFIGIGGMGYGMAANLAGNGFLSAVYNRTRDKAEAFVQAHGSMALAEPGAVPAQAEVIVLCVSADEDVLAMVDQLVPHLTPSHVVIDCSTVSSGTARQVAQRVAKAGAAFVDAPVSGGPEGAQDGTLSIMVGADDAVYQRVLPVLEAMGTRVTHMGPIGAGQATKAVNQVMMAGINQAVCEALGFARDLDLPLDQVVDVVGSGAAGNWFVNKRGKNMTRQVFDPGFKLKHHHKDLGISLSMACQHNSHLPLTDQTREQYSQLLDNGYGEEDISALYRLWNHANED